mgnify:CR=1 FL=1
MKSILGQEKDRRLYHRKPTKFSVHRSSLLIPKIKNFLTQISFLNHFLLKRNNNQVSLKLSAYNNYGRCIDTFFEELKEKKVYAYSLDHIFNDKKIVSYQAEFFSGKNLFILFPAVIVSHFSNNCYNMVHSYNRILNDKEEDFKINSEQTSEGAIESYFNKDIESGFILHAGQKKINQNLELQIYKNRKKIIKKIKLNLNPFNTKLISLKKYIDQKSIGISNDQVFFVKVPKQELFYGRLLAGLYSSKKKYLSMNHSYYNSNNTKEYFKDTTSSRIYPFFKNYNNELLFYPLNSKSNLEIILKFPNNKEVSCGFVKSPGSKVLKINLNKILEENNLNFEMFELIAKSKNGKIPTRVNHQFIVGSNKSKIKASINNNLVNKFVYLNLSQKKGFCWGPIYLNKNYNTHLSIYNYYLTCKKNPAYLKIYSSNRLIYKTKINMKNDKPVIFDNKYLDKIRISNNLNEICWYTVGSQNNNINAISFHMNKKSHNASGEHSF